MPGGPGHLAQRGHLDRNGPPATGAARARASVGRPDWVGLTGSVDSVEVLVEEALGLVDARPRRRRGRRRASEVSPPSPISTLGMGVTWSFSRPAWTVFIVRSSTISKLASFWSA